MTRMPRSQPAISSSVRLRPAGHLEPAAEHVEPPSSVRSGRCHLLLLRPEARVRQISAARPFSIQTDAPRAAALRRRTAAPSRSGIGRIGVERHALVDDLLADPRAAARLGERAAPFVRGARVERAGEQRHEVGDRLRLEHGGVQARLDRLRVAARHRLLRGRAADRRRDRSCPSRARRRWPSRCRCRPACAPSSTGRRRSCGGYANRPLLVATATALALRLEKPGGEHLAAALPAASRAATARFTAPRAPRDRDRRCAR